MSFRIGLSEIKSMGWFFGASEECRLHHSMLDEIVGMLLVQRWELGRSAEMIQETYDSSELFKFVRGQREFWQRACRIADAKRKVRVYAMRRKRQHLSQRLAQSDAKSISLHASAPVPPTFSKKGGRLYALEMGA